MNEFELAFNKCMTYEIGSFNPQDPDVISGNIKFPRKVGYTNIKADRGGETKYGIAKSGNPGVDITNLNLAGAMQIYRTQYWLTGKCDQLTPKLGMIHFDGCVNHGVGRSCQFLYRALRITPEYKVLGPVILSKLNDTHVPAYAQVRRNFYLAIVKNDPTQSVFLKGWMRRIDEMEAFCS